MVLAVLESGTAEYRLGSDLNIEQFLDDLILADILNSL